MALSGTDSYGTYTDTGNGSTATVRTSVEIEYHYSWETDTGSSLSPLLIAATHSPHRSSTSPR